MPDAMTVAELQAALAEAPDDAAVHIHVGGAFALLEDVDVADVEYNTGGAETVVELR